MGSDNEKTQCRQKVRYSNEASAKAAIGKINPARKLRRPYRSYRCPVCSGYHLTSSAKR